MNKFDETDRKWPLGSIESIADWAICDNFCCNSAWAKKADRNILWQYIVKLLRGGEQWSVRVETVLAMCHYLDDGSIDRTLTEIESIGLKESEPYYVRMGVAWLLATALAKDEERTREFVSLFYASHSRKIQLQQA